MKRKRPRQYCPSSDRSTRSSQPYLARPSLGSDVFLGCTSGYGCAGGILHRDPPLPIWANDGVFWDGWFPPFSGSMWTAMRGRRRHLMKRTPFIAAYEAVNRSHCTMMREAPAGEHYRWSHSESYADGLPWRNLTPPAMGMRSPACLYLWREPAGHMGVSGAAVPAILDGHCGGVASWVRSQMRSVPVLATLERRRAIWLPGIAFIWTAFPPLCLSAKMLSSPCSVVRAAVSRHLCSRT